MTTQPASSLSVAQPGRAASILGWILTIVPSLLLLFSGGMKLTTLGATTAPKEINDAFTQIGWPTNLAGTLGIVEVLATLLFLFPRTAVLGAILITGYMGGAIASHVRVGDPFAVQAAVGVVIWFALYLREPRLRALLPWRSR